MALAALVAQPKTEALGGEEVDPALFVFASGSSRSPGMGSFPSLGVPEVVDHHLRVPGSGQGFPPLATTPPIGVTLSGSEGGFPEGGVHHALLGGLG